MERKKIVKARNSVRKLLDTLRPGKTKYCCLCDSKVSDFFSYRGGKRAPLMVAVQTIGSDVENFGCPQCNCHDRERHLFLYLQAEGFLEEFSEARVLHFAPEQQLSRIIQSLRPSKYVKADLHPAAEDVECLDLLKIDYPDSSFDFVIANHVLEHVDDDLQALSEIRRVLQPGGYAILQTPYSGKLTRTFSDPGIDNRTARFQAYGQEDHVRLFGTDIFSRIESVGFVSRVAAHHEKLLDVDCNTFGVNEREPFFLYEKSNA